MVTAWPCTVTDAFEARFDATCSAFASVAAELTAPRNPFRDAARACEVTSMNLGAAIAARMPSTRMTMTSSIRVKPRGCFLIPSSLQKLKQKGGRLAAARPAHTLQSISRAVQQPPVDAATIAGDWPLVVLVVS